MPARPKPSDDPEKKRRHARRQGFLGLGAFALACLLIVGAVLADVPPYPWLGLPLLALAAAGLFLMVLSRARAFQANRQLGSA